MISILLDGHDLADPLKEILRLFSTGSATLGVDPSGLPAVQAEGPSIRISSSFRTTSSGCLVEMRDLESGHFRQATIPVAGTGTDPFRIPAPVRRELKRQLYFLLSERTGVRPPWGSLTGIRPTFVAEEYLTAGLSGVDAAHELERTYGVSAAKAALAVRVAAAEAKLLARFPESDAAVYISIPFCTTRCSYCSFPSDTFDRVRDRLPDYLDALLREARRVGEELSCQGRRASCLYVGGGSPAVLSAREIGSLLLGLRQRIPFRDGAETTFEAGRCDDLDADKIAACARGGVDRLCLNPQSTDAGTLARIGRPAAGDRLGEWTALARSTGISRLSMDLIAGLPGEEEPAFLRSLDDVLSLDPDNITVHALSIKRGSPLSSERPDVGTGGASAARMVDAAHVRLDSAGFEPYYLYRQKETVGGLENTGFTRPGAACLYNVAMMGDRRTVYGIGAGATTKRIVPGSARIERRVSPSDLRTYLDRIAPTCAEG